MMYYYVYKLRPARKGEGRTMSFLTKVAQLSGGLGVGGFLASQILYDGASARLVPTVHPAL
jgi:hypothetical protein